MEALEYACSNDFPFIGANIAGYAAGAAVALVGRNEGGKTLSREAVTAIVHNCQRYFRGDTVFAVSSAKTVLDSGLSRVMTMAISDANKRLMLQCDGLIDTLVHCLLLDPDNKRRTQDDGDALQEAAAGILHELSLFGPWADALKAHSGVMASLHELLDVGTKTAKERAAAALFELDDEARAAATASSGDDGSGTGLDASPSKPPPHIMMSYNWDHQDVILRVVAWLQAHGYLVWVDTEQMKGSTVDTMALAVEGSEV
eukprot:COSAG04_NODE_10516_length_771_cov_2.190476_1_plen_257_part_11